MKTIKSLRLDKGLNQQTVANYLGITQQAYANYERGVRQPDPDTLLKLADFLDALSMSYLDELLYTTPLLSTKSLKVWTSHSLKRLKI